MTAGTKVRLELMRSRSGRPVPPTIRTAWQPRATTSQDIAAAENRYRAGGVFICNHGGRDSARREGDDDGGDPSLEEEVELIRPVQHTRIVLAPNCRENSCRTNTCHTGQGKSRQTF